VDAIRYNPNPKSPAPRYLLKLLRKVLSKNSAMDFKLFEVWITKPGDRVTTDARNVMPTSNANFWKDAWLILLS